MVETVTDIAKRICQAGSRAEALAIVKRAEEDGYDPMATSFLQTVAHRYITRRGWA